MRHHKLFWGSSYDRGLQHLLKMWPEIKKAYPDATLDVCYGWNLFLTAYRDNAERMAWMKRMGEMMKQPRITHHGRVGKEELKEIRSKCGIWSYPTDFTEINCITALEAQADGLVPVVINYAALKETVGSGIKIDGDIYDKETQQKYLKELLALMGNKERWKKESKKAQKFAQKFSWDRIADLWLKHFD